jgi:outer membrane protein assembly factor BamB
VAHLENPKKLIEWWGKGPNREARRKRRRIIIISVLSALAVLLVILGLNNFTDIFSKPVKALNSLPSSGDWAMFGRDLSHSASINSSGPSLQGTVKTVLSSGAAMHSSPAIANGIVYVGSRDFKLYAIDASTGKELWEFQAGSWIDSSPTIVDNVVYFGSNDGKMYALNAQNGSKLWEFTTKYPIKSTPAVADGRVYFGGEDYDIYALDAKTGRQIWRVRADDAVSSSPAVANGIVYIGSLDGYMYAIDARSGKVRLKFPAKRAVVASPVVSGDTVYCNTANGMVFALNGLARNWLWEEKIRTNWQILHVYGALPAPPAPSGYLWGLDLAGTTSSSPSLSGDSLYLGVGSKIVSVNVLTEEKNWEFTADGLFSSLPVVVNNTVYAANEDGHLYVLNAATGEKLKDIAVGGKITSSPAVTGNTVYISSEDGNLYAVN